AGALEQLDNRAPADVGLELSRVADREHRAAHARHGRLPMLGHAHASYRTLLRCHADCFPSHWPPRSPPLAAAGSRQLEAGSRPPPPALRGTRARASPRRSREAAKAGRPEAGSRPPPPALRCTRATARPRRSREAAK